MKRLLIATFAVCAMLGIAGTAPAAGGNPLPAHSVHVALSSYGGSGVTGTVDIHPVGTGQAQIDLEAMGLLPRTVYTAFYDPGDDCANAHHTLGTFTTNTRGIGTLHAKVLGRVTSIGTVAVRLGLANDGTLLACASIGTPDVDPTVVATTPLDGAADVPVGTVLTARFSEAMDPPSLDPSTFLLKAGATQVAGSVVYDATTWTATFTPASPLAPNTIYTAFITTGATDMTGEGLEVDYSWHFITGPAPSNQVQALGNVFAAGHEPPVRFTVPLNSYGGSGVTGSILIHSVGPNLAMIDLDAFGLAPRTVYTVFYDPGDDCENAHHTLGSFTSNVRGEGTLHGKVLGRITDIGAIGVRLGTENDGTLVACASIGTPDVDPTVVSTSPVDGAADVSVGSVITATFSEAMDPPSLDINSFLLKAGATSIPGTVVYDPGTLTATFTPSTFLVPNTVYTAIVTTGATDMTGEGLEVDYTWHFLTQNAAVDQAPIALGAAASFGVLAGTGVASTGPSAINGDLGVSPGTSATGFPPGTVSGATHLGDATAAQAQLDLHTAYFEAHQRTTGARRVDGNIGGMTLSPGLYNAPTALDITSGDLTLDARGDAHSVFLFTIGTTLTAASARSVLLTNGAQAANVYWLVTTSATIGTGASFKGNILALNDITVMTGAHVEGRMLSHTGAVTLDNNVISVPQPPDPSAPDVHFTVPGNGETDVAETGKVTASFSVPMDPTSINAATFTLSRGITPVAGTVSFTGLNAIFAPTAQLAPLTTYTAVITTGAKSLDGHALPFDYAWTFTTGSHSDVTRPVAIAVTPASAEIGVPLNQILIATFSEAIDPATINSSNFTLMQGATPVPGAVKCAGNVATFTPASNLAPMTVYTAKIFDGIMDLSGNALLSDFTWSFTSDANIDATRPLVVFTIPPAGANAVGVNQSINATFSEAMDPLSINLASMTLKGPGGVVVFGTVAYDEPSRIATFRPTSPLAGNTVYTATMTTGAKDLSGNTLAANVAWTFTTGNSPFGQAPVALGSANSFYVLASTSVANTGASTVNGDLGVSPGNAVTGFPPGAINGFIHPGDAAAAQAQLDLHTAYFEAHQRTAGAHRLNGPVAGRTLTPGLYVAPLSLDIAGGDLTLDALGDANAVFLFQVGSTLSISSGENILLTNGARAANIYWLVTNTATIGTGSAFKGNILALGDITVMAGAHVNGRMLSHGGAVTLNNDVIGPESIQNALALAAKFAVTSDAAVGVANGVSLKGNPLMAGPATIRFGLARADQVHINVYNVSGRLVRALVNGDYTAGAHEVVWNRLDTNGRVVPRGVYFTRVRYDAQRFEATNRLIILE